MMAEYRSYKNPATNEKMYFPVVFGRVIQTTGFPTASMALEVAKMLEEQDKPKEQGMSIESGEDFGAPKILQGPPPEKSDDSEE